MARRRNTPPADTGPADRSLTVRLHLADGGDLDWSHSAEGALVLYDPAVVTEEVLADLAGLGPATGDDLWWLVGQPRGAEVHRFPRWDSDATDPRAAGAARRVGRAARLCWDRALLPLNLIVTDGGFRVRLTTGPLTAAERQDQDGTSDRWRRTVWRLPLTGGLALRADRLGVTWGFVLGIPPDQCRELFGPGHRAEVAWPAGEYQVRAWGDFEGEGRAVVQLTRVPPAGWGVPVS